jgi:O-antigen/teichoic acid export membrane protein
MKAANRVAKNTGILYAKMAITVFISLYSTRLILNALGAEDYGIFNIVGGTIAMLGFLNASMAAATQRFMSIAEGAGDLERKKNIFSVSVVLHFVIALVVFFVLEIVGYIFFQSVLNIPADRIDVAKLVYQFMIVTTLFTIISVPYDALLNSHENMLMYSVFGIIEVLLKLSIAIYITYTGFDKLITYGLLMAALSILSRSIQRYYCHRKYEESNISIRKYYNKTLFKEMTSFGGWSLLFSAASMITMQGVSIVLNSFFGVLVNAAQGVATQISGQLMAFSNTMLKALNPVIVKSAGGNDRRQMMAASVIGNKLSFFLFTFFSIPAIIEMPYILHLWLKNVPDYAVIFCQLNLFRLCITQLTITFNTTIAALGNIKEFNIVRSSVYVALLPASYFMYLYGAPPFAIYINLIVMILISMFVNVYYVQKLCGYTIQNFLQDIFSRCAITALFNSAISILPLFLLPSGLFRLILVVIISSSTFIISLHLFGLTKPEKKMMLSMISGKISKIKSKSKP